MQMKVIEGQEARDTINTSDLVGFLRNRASVERQMGTNQLMCGDETGKLRTDRANQFDGASDHFAVMQARIVVLESTVKSISEQNKVMKDKLKNYGET